MKKIFALVLLGWCLALAQSALAANDASLAAMKAAYAAHSSGDEEKACAFFLKAYKLDKTNLVALKELAYAYLRRGQPDKAIARFRDVLTAEPDDMRTRMDLAYALQKKGDSTDAKKEFTTVAEGKSGTFAAQAKLELANMLAIAAAQKTAATAAKQAAPAVAQPAVAKPAALAAPAISTATPQAAAPAQPDWRRYYTEVFLTPYHMSRFNDTIEMGEARFYMKTGRDSPLAFYAGATYVDDSRSQGGISPQIYNDNTFALGLGARLDAAAGISLTVEAMRSYNLIRSADHPDAAETNLRAVLAGYWEVQERLCGPLGLASLGKIRGAHLYTTLGGSVGYYSRYANNIIAQAQAMEGWRFIDSRNGRVAVYIRSEALADTDSYFFNNLAEIGPGLEYQPFVKAGLRLRLDYAMGFYTGRAGSGANPYPAQYHDTRVSCNYGVRF
jgi:Flp pilus assembly protein TadD